MEDVFHFKSVITKKKWICSAFRWLHFVDQNVFSTRCAHSITGGIMVNRRVKCKYRYEVSHKKSCSGVNTIGRFAKKANVVVCKTISEAWIPMFKCSLWSSADCNQGWLTIRQRLQNHRWIFKFETLFDHLW